MIINGAYGPYIKGPGRFNNIKIPKEQDPKKITFEEAKQMLDSKPAGRGKFARKNTKTNTKSAKKASSTAKKASKKSTSRTTKVSTKTPRKASKTAK